MKAILIILILALGGLTYKFQRDAKSAKARMIAAEDAEHEAKSAANEIAAELDSAKLKISKLESDLSRVGGDLETAKNQIAAAETAYSNRFTQAQASAEQSRSAAEVVASIEAKRDAALAALETKYQAAVAEVTAQKAALVANQEKAKLAHAALKDNPPAFAEQRSTDRNVSGKAGIRTSQADRQEAMAKYEADLNAVTTLIANLKGEALTIDARERAIRETYNAEKARIHSQY